MEYLTEVCTCDDNCDSPCPRHKRENELQDAVIDLTKKIKELRRSIKELERAKLERAIDLEQ